MAEHIEKRKKRKKRHEGDGQGSLSLSQVEREFSRVIKMITPELSHSQAEREKRKSLYGVIRAVKVKRGKK